MWTTACKPQQPDLVAKAIVPDYALGSHTASLGPDLLRRRAPGPRIYQAAPSSASMAPGTASRSRLSVVFVPFKDGKPAGMPQDVLTGFLDADGNA